MSGRAVGRLLAAGTSLEAAEIAFVVPYDRDLISVLAEQVGLLARHQGFDEREVARVRLALQEACRNVLDHARPPAGVSHFGVTCRYACESLTIRVWDAGPPFDLSRVPQPQLEAPLEKRRIGPLGLFLMRQTMDEVRVEEMQDGKAVVLVKRRRPPAFDATER